ncbi:MAG: family of carbohydrate kinase, N-terminal domain protein, partial [Acidimicrobiales bacterium]|nr:family of carbohydrate kinase, N-terminal domain protein [Acidimicrobiales bacterium]
AGEVLTLIMLPGGGVEQDPHQWWAAIGRCARRAIASSGLHANDIDLVAVTSQYSSTVAVAADGTPLANAVLWMDQRGRRHNPALDPDHASRWVELHGMRPSGNDDIGHVAMIRAEWPDVYASAAAFVEPMDAIAARLTGHVSATQGTMFPMFAVDNRTWGATDYSDELLAMSTLERAKLPELVPMGSPRGTITADAALHLGVSPTAVVSGATIDSVTSAIGTGAVDAGTCGLIIGTTSVMVTHLDSKRHDPAHGLTTAPSPVPGQYFLVAENGVGGKALDVFVNNVVYPDDGLGAAAPDDAYERVLAAAATVPAGANGLMFLPWLVGSMAPAFQRRIRGGFVNIGLGTTRLDMARAVLEGVGHNASWLLPHFAALADQDYREVSLGGGGAGSALWGQILADCFGVPVRRLANSRSTNAHGAALLALAERGTIALGDVRSVLTTEQLHEPDPAAHATYRRLLTSFVEFHDLAAPFYGRLNARETTPS